MISDTKDKTSKRTFIIDFDSTLVKDETIDVLADIALKDNPERIAIAKKVSDITTLGMEGEITFSESLKKRLALFTANKSHLQATTEYLASRITPSILRNREFFVREGKNIYIISNGFKECILPIALELGIDQSHILANSAKFNTKGNLVGVEPGPLSEGSGKAKVVKSLKLLGEVIVIGDGMTDYEIRSSGAASTFFAFIENVERASVVKKADFVVRSIDELLYQYRLPRAIYYPHGKLKVLLLEKIHPLAEIRFKEDGYSVVTIPKALSEEELVEVVKDVAILGIRSTTQVTERVLNAAPKLLSVGAFCVGVNQVNLSAASKKGIAVFNAPYANGRSVIELAAGLIIALSRRAFDKSVSLHQGTWDKSAKDSHEVRGKTLGIVGYGNIGSQLSVVAEAFGMNVLFYDMAERPAIGNAKKVRSLPELLKLSDVVSLHLDGRAENKNLFGKAQFEQMRKGALLLNLSRGSIIDLDALAQALKSGQIGGAAIDVFPEEPKGGVTDFSSPLQGLPNVILTPHIGGSTEEAQENIAHYMCGKIATFIDMGDTALSANFPHLQLPSVTGTHRFTHIHRNVPGVLANINAVLSNNRANILGQFLGTNHEIGYVITDAITESESKVIEELNTIPETIRVRTIY